MNIQNIKVSVIIPVYNAGQWLLSCISSVSSQNLKEIEIICVDDGSTDNSLKLIQDLMRKDKRIKLLKQDHQGSGAARNLGIKSAKGEFVIFMDADDEYPDDTTLSVLYENAKKHKVFICGGEFSIFNGDKTNLIQDFPQNLYGYTFDSDGVVEYKDYQFDYGYHRFLYNRKFLIDNDIFFPDYKRFQDPVFFVNAMIHAKKFYALHRITYCYRIGHQNINWDYEKTFGVLSGVRDILILAHKYNYEELEKLAIIRLQEHINFMYGFLYGPNTSVTKQLLEIDRTYKTNKIKKIIKNKKKLIFYKEILPNGRRHIYIFGIKVFSYFRKFKIKDYEYVHLCHNDKFIKPFVDFCNRNFDPKKHVFLCQHVFNQFDFPQGLNVIKMDSPLKFNFSSKKIKKIICHSLFVGDIVKFLYQNKRLLKKKAYWMIWGGDLYNARRNKEEDYVRRHFCGYISDTDGDIDVAKNKYNSKPKCEFEAGYTFPVTADMIKKAKRVPHKHVSIQINNSADDSTLEMLDVLSRFKNENIKIRTILSYAKTEYNDQIIKKGESYFGKKFEHIDNLMHPAEYAKYMASNDILILNQNRQQGLGNSFVALVLGLKLFIRSEITTYNHFNSKGIKVFDTNEIKKMNFNEFVKYADDIRKNNQKKAHIFFEDSYLRKLWAPVFDEQ